MFRRQWFEFDELWFFGFTTFESDYCDLVQKGAVLHFCQAMLFRAGSTVDVVACIGLSDEDRAF